jgi:phospholipase C
MNRRTFLSAGLGSSLAIVGGTTTSCSTRVPVAPAPRPVPPDPALPSPQESGLEHVVIVTMENRSFDHLLGWLPHASGIPAGLAFPDNAGITHPAYALSGDYTGCGHPVPNMDYGPSNRTAYNQGKMDGFLRVPGNDLYSIGYYPAEANPFLAALAQAYTTCDHWFASILAETFPNRLFLWTAQTDRLSNTLSLSSLPTIFDRLAKAGISHRYYFGNLPFLALWGLKYLTSSSTVPDFLSDVSTGQLPAVSFVDPQFTEFDDGLGNDDHPHSDIRNGDAFLSRIFHAVATGPKWAHTVLMVIFDEWGGFFDHVPPPRVIAPNHVDPDLVNGGALLGFRVPAVIASPFTRGVNQVDSTVYDHTACLKLIEWRWQLPALTRRDGSPAIGNPAVRFHFTSPDTSLPPLPQPGSVPGLSCFLRDLTAKAQSATTVPQPPVTEFGALANTSHVRDWLHHPRFQQR